MRYTLEQYINIIDDTNATIAYIEEEEEEKAPFRCNRTDCSFCPFFNSTSNRCPDCHRGSLGLPLEKWATARTADEWRKWLDVFETENDPFRPYSVTISEKFAYYIEMALRLGTVDDDEIVKLLEVIRKQINDQNRG